MAYYFSLFSPSEVIQEKISLPPIKNNHVRLELPLVLFFPYRKETDITLHFQSTNKQIASATLIAKIGSKEPKYLVDIHKKDMNKIIGLAKNSLEAYPAVTIQKIKKDKI